MGRPEHRATQANRNLVEQYAAMGIPQEHIAMKIGVTAPTLRKHYHVQLELGAADSVAAVASKMYSMIMDESSLTSGAPRVPASVKASIGKFWLERRGGMAWRMPERVGNGGPGDADQGPQMVVKIFNLPSNRRAVDTPKEINWAEYEILDAEDDLTAKGEDNEES